MPHINIYWNRQNGVYVRPLVTFFSFWWILVCGLTLLFYFVSRVKIFAYLQIIFDFFLLFFVILSFVGLAYIVYESKQKHGFLNFCRSANFANIIQKKLVETKNLNRLKDVQKILVPWVDVTFIDNEIKIEIAKIAGMQSSDLDNLAELVNSELIGKYASFAVSTRYVSDNQLTYVFLATDVASNLTWRPRTVAELKQAPYILRLQKGLTIDLSKTPGLGIFGKSGSGKSTIVWACIAQLLSNNSEILFLDGKREYSVLNTFYPNQYFFYQAEEMIKALEVIVEKEIPSRQRKFDQAQREKGMFGLTGKDLNFKPLVIVADEVGNVPRTPKERKELGTLLTTILQRGRSVSVFLIWSTQDPAVSASMSVLGQGGISQLSTKILVGSAKREVQVQALGEAIEVGDVPKFRGYYITDGLKEPQRFYVPDLYHYHLMQMDTFKKLYNERSVPIQNIILNFDDK